MSISVVIPAYNAERFIAETLQSVLAQTLQPDEIVVVDDGSTDGTLQIVEAFAPRVRVLHTANQRAAAARNFGVQHTTGEWLAFLDADDIWLPHKLERQMAALAADPAADLCYSGFVDLQDDGRTAVLGRDCPAAPTSRVRRALLRGTTFIPSTVVMRRSTFLSVGGFTPSRRYAQDWDLWMRLYTTPARFIGCTEPLIHYRTHPGNMSANTIASLDSAKDVYRTYVMPLLPAPTRWYHHRRFLAQYEYGAACQLRDQRSPQAMPLLLTAIGRQPFCLLKRYKTLALMMSVRVKRAWGELCGYDLSVERP